MSINGPKRLVHIGPPSNSITAGFGFIVHAICRDNAGSTTENSTIKPRKRIDAMTDITLKIQEDILTFDVSDEVLEIAGGAARERTNFTLGACTGLSECPGSPA
jgi:hypothetical protein